MRKSLPILITSLLAAPALAAAPVAAMNSGVVAPLVIPATSELVAAVRRRLDSLEGEPLDAHGMQNLHRRMAADVNTYLDQAVQSKRWRSVQMAMAPGGAAVHMEKAPFLGVATSPVTVILREQLNLKPGMGLVVDYVDKDSPADSSGIKVHDILEKLDDQWLVNPQQLAVLVRSHKAGDAVAFTVIHGGQRVTVSPKLTEKELPPLEAFSDPTVNPNAGGAGGSSQIIALPPGFSMPNNGVFTLPGGNGFGVQPGPAQANFSSRASFAMSRDDGEHVISIDGDEQGRHLKIVDKKTGQEIFNGPYHSDQDLQSLPADLQAKVKTLQANVTVTPPATAPAPH